MERLGVLAMEDFYKNEIQELLKTAAISLEELNNRAPENKNRKLTILKAVRVCLMGVLVLEGEITETIKEIEKVLELHGQPVEKFPQYTKILKTNNEV